MSTLAENEILEHWQWFKTRPAIFALLSACARYTYLENEEHPAGSGLEALAPREAFIRYERTAHLAGLTPKALSNARPLLEEQLGTLIKVKDGNSGKRLSPVHRQPHPREIPQLKANYEIWKHANEKARAYFRELIKRLRAKHREDAKAKKEGWAMHYQILDYAEILRNHPDEQMRVPRSTESEYFPTRGSSTSPPEEVVLPHLRNPKSKGVKDTTHPPTYTPPPIVERAHTARGAYSPPIESHRETPSDLPTPVQSETHTHPVFGGVCFNETFGRYEPVDRFSRARWRGEGCPDVSPGKSPTHTMHARRLHTPVAG